MYHHTDSRRVWRTGQRATKDCSSPPSSAAAKAAAAAKAFHRRAQERAQEIELRKRQKLRDDEQACCVPLRNHPHPRNDVFRRIAHLDDCSGGMGQGSILKRLTAATCHLPNTRPHAHSTIGNSSGEEETVEKGNFCESHAPKHSNLTSAVQTVCPHPRSVTRMRAYATSSGFDGQENDADKESVTVKLDNKQAQSNPHLLCTRKALQYQYSSPRSYREGGFTEAGANFWKYSEGVFNPHLEQKSDHRDDGVPSQKKDQNDTAKATSVGKPEHSTVSQGVITTHSPLPLLSSTRRIIGSHTPIHVPRAALHDVEEPLPYKQPLKQEGACDPGSVFRSSGKDSNGEDERAQLSESSAHKILLSLSKSFDRADDKHPRRGVLNTASEGRPTSPDEPPRIQHWHKQSSNSFEPQPSPLKLSYLKDSDGINIDLTSSFTLFNESFDMNLEGLLGPSASFGLGAMSSLSFGLGLGTSVDHGDSPRTSSIIIQGREPIAGQDDANGQETATAMSMKSTHSGRLRENLQVLKMSKLSSIRHVSGTDQHGIDETVSSDRLDSCSVMVPRESLSGCLSVGHHNHPSGTENAQNLKGSGANESLCSPDNPNFTLAGEEGHVKYGIGPHREQDECSPKLDQRLFGAMERHYRLFSSFSYLLPGAKSVLTKNRSHNGSQGEKAVRGQTQLSEQELELARRRVNSALCAFGGVVISPADSEVWLETKKLCQMQKYRESIPERYFEDESRLSWEIEEDPPIEVSDSEEGAYSPGCGNSSVRGDEENLEGCDLGKGRHEHTTKSSLQRSIGTMVYPAVNAFTATEPGVLTPALSEMNNFIDKNKALPDSTPAKASNELSVGLNSFLPMVSPESVRPGAHPSSSASFLISRKSPQCSLNYVGGAWISNQQSPRKTSPGRKLESHMTDLLFVDRQVLRPEQYRTVSHKKRKSSSAHYMYPALPLPYGQRKRISNAMFAMSKSIPGLTDECASVLGEARRKDAWDFAVAQLMTQVIVVTHCSAEDSRLDGLSKYLLTLGIAC